MRWRHPQRGLVPPALFIPVAEENGLITPMGDWALQAACRQVKQWFDSGLPETTVAVNLSARQFRDRDVARLVAATLEETGCPAHLLEVELTESLVIQDIDRTIEVLARLKEMKVAASMDDFGTGYSSLSQLKRLSLSTLKIDQSFVRDIVTDPHSATIATTIIAMAHALGLKVIAEGVETEAQLGFLRGRGCDEMQGYYFSKPVPVAEFAALLREGRGLTFGASPGEDPSRTLLLVDDEINILSALKRLLRRDGYTILTASSGQEGLELLARHPVGVIVSDQRMPEMMGTEFLSRVKEIHPESVRMILSGYSELSTLTEAINRGAVYKFLAKPWDEEDLRATIKEAFRRYDRQRRDGGEK
jgi:EAL domain-containing protein (putative c-di-GMP-specific phosphodiesterase class I)/CheY-like chemotaxis protein